MDFTILGIFLIVQTYILRIKVLVNIITLRLFWFLDKEKICNEQKEKIPPYAFFSRPIICPEITRSVPRCQKFQKVPKEAKNCQNMPKVPKSAKSARKYQNVPKSDKYYQKFQWVQNGGKKCQKSPKGAKSISANLRTHPYIHFLPCAGFVYFVIEPRGRVSKK